MKKNIKGVAFRLWNESPKLDSKINEIYFW